MGTIGYARLVERLGLRVRPLRTPAAISGSVNRRVDTPTQVLFPRGVAIEDSIVGHLEFALRHEGINLEVIDAVYEHLQPQELIGRLNAAPTGAQIRRACFLWEWLTGQTLPIEATPTGGYIEFFPGDQYVTAANPTNNRKYRVRDNALGTADFCPTVLRSSVPPTPSLTDLLDEARRTLDAVTDPSLYERAVSYLYLSETRSSFAIENERPSSDRQERFVQLLRRAGETAAVSADWLVSLQNVVVRDAFSQEASYRARQNWLEDASGRVTFFPPPPDELQRAMAGWEAFTNDSQRCTDALVKAACAQAVLLPSARCHRPNRRTRKRSVSARRGAAERRRAQRITIFRKSRRGLPEMSELFERMKRFSSRHADGQRKFRGVLLSCKSWCKFGAIGDESGLFWLQNSIPVEQVQPWQANPYQPELGYGLAIPGLGLQRIQGQMVPGTGLEPASR